MALCFNMVFGVCRIEMLGEGRRDEIRLMICDADFTLKSFILEKQFLSIVTFIDRWNLEIMKLW